MKRKCWSCVYRKKCSRCKKSKIISQFITDLRYDLFIRKLAKYGDFYDPVLAPHK